MMMNPIQLYLFLSVLGSSTLRASPFLTSAHQVDDPAYPHWIAPAQTDATGLFLFRKTFELDRVPESFVIHLSADPRYRLWVNGDWVTFGPAAGHFYHWNYETLDIQSYLVKGSNVLAVEVRQAGSLNGPREVSFWTGMILAGPEVNGKTLQSDASWKVLRSEGWQPIEMTPEQSVQGYIAGATESWTASDHPQGWTDIGFDDRHWPKAVLKNKGSHVGLNTWKVFNYRYLKPRPFPLVETSIRPLMHVRRSSKSLENDPISPSWPIAVPANIKLELLLDNAVVENGFPMLEISGGSGSEITVHYQEALYDAEGRKGNRNRIDGKTMRGIFDRFHPDGSSNHVFEPFWMRTFRYVQVTIETAEEPLVFERMQYRQTRYPFQKLGGFSSTTDERIHPIQEASWRTLELCALETYMDCPYYEQLQYIGDTRIQSLVSLYLTGDDRLMRNAIHQFHDSLQPMGLIRSSFPISGTAAQIIPPFSFVFVSMIHDHFLYFNDTDLIREKLPAIAYILSWFIERVGADGLMGPLPFWNHTDGGAAGYFNGSPPGSEEGGSVQLSLMLAIALDQTAELYHSQGDLLNATRMEELSGRIKQAVIALGWDESRKLMAETPEKRVFSQHTNALAILAGVVPVEDVKALANSIATNAELIQATLYFQFYVFEAYQKAGSGDLIVSQLDRWMEFLNMGLTTFPEHHLESRSDTHAWAAHPLYHLPASVAGIRPAVPGFEKVRLQPTPGTLDQLSATVVLPHGLLQLDMTQHLEKDHWQLELSLPDGVEAELLWHDAIIPIHSQQRSILLKLP